MTNMLKTIQNGSEKFSHFAVYAGGMILVLAAAVFLFLQNALGVLLAFVFGADPAYGLMAGSISFAGGHGTAIAWGAEFEAAGHADAGALGLTFATFGLVAGGLVGGPIAHPRQIPLLSINHFILNQAYDL